MPVAVGSLELDSNETDVDAVSLLLVLVVSTRTPYGQYRYNPTILLQLSLTELSVAAHGQHFSATGRPRADGRLCSRRRWACTR